MKRYNYCFGANATYYDIIQARPFLYKRRKEEKKDTFNPLARFMARRGLNTRNTRRTLTTENAPELETLTWR